MVRAEAPWWDCKLEWKRLHSCYFCWQYEGHWYLNISSHIHVHAVPIPTPPIEGTNIKMMYDFELQKYV